MITGKSLEPAWEWAKGELEKRPLGSFSSLCGMTIFYLIMISTISFLMWNRRVKDKSINKQSNKVKSLMDQISKLKQSEVDDSRRERLNKELEQTKKSVADLKATYKPINISWITIPHNLIMCIYSLYAFVGMSLVILFETFPQMNYNWYSLFCDRDVQLSKDLDFWVYTFYLSKFVEYIDTVLLLIKAKPVMPPENTQYLLHIYHHAITAAIVWATLYYPFSTAWTGPWTNSLVHTFMYGYYFLAELNMIDRSLGGKFITPIQLLQFAFCMGAVIYETLQPNCNSHFYVIVFLLSNYLIFFLFFSKIFWDKMNERNPNKKKLE